MYLYYYKYQILIWNNFKVVQDSYCFQNNSTYKNFFI